jgi:hypothetical protein
MRKGPYKILVWGVMRNVPLKYLYL